MVDEQHHIEPAFTKETTSDPQWRYETSSNSARTLKDLPSESKSMKLKRMNCQP